jgi:hypothetical protein
MDDPCDPWFAPEPHVWTIVRFFYQRWLPFFVLVVIFGWLLFVHFLKPPHPPIGSYIGSLALLVAVVTIWPPESNWSKAAWLMVFFALTGLEISTLYQDRTENQEQQAKARRDEDDRFDGILKQNDNQFKATISEFTNIEKGTERVAALSENNLKNVTGGNSFAYLIPQIDNSPAVRFALYNRGDAILTGVTVSITRTGGPPEALRNALYGSPIEVGTVSSRGVRLLQILFTPSPLQKEGIETIFVIIGAQNGQVVENIQFRQSQRKGQAWGFRYQVDREGNLGQLYICLIHQNGVGLGVRRDPMPGRCIGPLSGIDGSLRFAEFRGR